MCGLFGFTGRREAGEVLLDGIRRLEYRGYDSAGVVTSTGDRLHVRKQVGRVADLARALQEHPAPGCHGIAHTRWATHGGVTEANAHPHTDETGDFALVHNGVIENFASLKRQLQAEGVVFRSDTDTEVLAHLVAR
ncbi:MAG TPA: class II glutamine amidotransferase, partial [Gemmataceae bacterium]|nr:class II glutamine amidotransferase [Gemmataceae bacterium]